MGSSLEIRPLTAAIGAEILGIDLREQLDDAALAAIRSPVNEPGPQPYATASSEPRSGRSGGNSSCNCVNSSWLCWRGATVWRPVTSPSIHSSTEHASVAVSMARIAVMSAGDADVP